MTFVQDRTAQFSPAKRHLPAARVTRFALIAVLMTPLAAASAMAQQVAVIDKADQPLFGEIGGARLGQLTQGASFAAGPSRQNHTQITLEGWIFRASLRAAGRDGHPLAVSRTPAENLRDAPNGRVLAQLVEGFLVDTLDRRGQWIRVRRQVWVPNSALRAPAATASRPAAAPAATQQAAASRQQAAAAPKPGTAASNTQNPAPNPAVDPRRAVVRRRMQLFRAPDSTAIGQLEAGTPVRITARANGWVRVEAQAWVRENEIRPSDSSIVTGLSAAELRGAPDEFKGRLLRWTIQFLALQTADELRADFQPGQKYILARGPAPEYAFVYILVPADQMAGVERLEPLATVTVVARVVNGRSTYLANPILELVEIQ
jgi:hypothetical protein